MSLNPLALCLATHKVLALAQQQNYHIGQNNSISFTHSYFCDKSKILLSYFNFSLTDLNY